MKSSTTISAIATALATVHQHLEPVVKDRQNPHFKNNYATLDAIMESVRPLLAGHGLAIVQGGAGPVSNNDGNLVGVSVETMLTHASGEFITSIIVLPLDKPSAQAVGSAITYGRRYGVAALLALTTEEDDDGHIATANAANVATPSRVAGVPSAAPKPATNGAAPVCPKCAGAMWDNRGENDKRAAEGKTLRPDWACKDKAKCDGVIWRPKATTAVPVGAGAPAGGSDDFPDALRDEPDNLPF